MSKVDHYNAKRVIVNIQEAIRECPGARYRGKAKDYTWEAEAHLRAAERAMWNCIREAKKA